MRNRKTSKEFNPDNAEIEQLIQVQKSIFIDVKQTWHAFIMAKNSSIRQNRWDQYCHARERLLHIKSKITGEEYKPLEKAVI